MNTKQREYKDALGSELFEGDEVAVIYCSSNCSRGVDLSVERGVVIGFTPVYVKIENIVTGTISNKSSKFMVKIFNQQ